jgi:hypothetical protein
MATEFCQKCKQSHPGRVCDYDDKGECSETTDVQEAAEKKTGSGGTQREPSDDLDGDHGTR